jgi:hypothetical protein
MHGRVCHMVPKGAYFNEVRPHQGIGQRIPGKQVEAVDLKNPVIVRAVLGELNHDYPDGGGITAFHCWMGEVANTRAPARKTQIALDRSATPHRSDALYPAARGRNSLE